MKTIKCNICKQEKPISEFYKTLRYCKNCSSIKSAFRYAKEKAILLRQSKKPKCKICKIVLDNQVCPNPACNKIHGLRSKYRGICQNCVDKGRFIKQ